MAVTIFITGTGTEVGKTVVTRALARAALRRHLRVVALKPVESGAVWRDGLLVGADAQAIATAAELDCRVFPNQAYCLPDPVSPHLAAARHGVDIDPASVRALLDRYRATHDLVLAEGAGGLLVPLREDLLQVEVYGRAGYDAVVVARDELGAINTTLLTLEALAARGMTVRGVILNRSCGVDFGNAAAIERHSGAKVLGTLPEAGDADDEHLARLAEECLCLDKLFASRCC